MKSESTAEAARVSRVHSNPSAASHDAHSPHRHNRTARQPERPEQQQQGVETAGRVPPASPPSASDCDNNVAGATRADHVIVAGSVQALSLTSTSFKIRRVWCEPLGWMADDGRARGQQPVKRSRAT